jgi:hypothetical protein
MTNQTPVSELTNAQVKAAAMKIVADKAAQKIKQTARNKAKLAYHNELVRVATEKGFLPAKS